MYQTESCMRVCRPAGVDSLIARILHRMQTCAQVLLTLDNLADRGQFLNAAHTFQELLAMGVVGLGYSSCFMHALCAFAGNFTAASTCRTALAFSLALLLLTFIHCYFLTTLCAIREIQSWYTSRCNGQT
jgi:hypothetical protein